MQDIKLKYSRAVLLITEFIESFVGEDPDILNKQQDIYLNIDEMYVFLFLILLMM